MLCLLTQNAESISTRKATSERRKKESKNISLHMEFGSERSRGDGVKDEKRSESGVGDDHEACRKQETVIEVNINFFANI